MPSGGPIKRNSARFLDGSNPEARDLARVALEEASTVSEAVERIKLLDGEEEAIVTEAFAVFDSLPQAIDRGLLATLRSALERSVPVVVDWELGEDIALRVTEVDNPPRVDIVLITRDGRTYVN